MALSYIKRIISIIKKNNIKKIKIFIPLEQKTNLSRIKKFVKIVIISSEDTNILELNQNQKSDKAP